MPYPTLIKLITTMASSNNLRNLGLCQPYIFYQALPICLGNEPYVYHILLTLALFIKTFFFFLHSLSRCWVIESCKLQETATSFLWWITYRRKSWWQWSVIKCKHSVHYSANWIWPAVLSGSQTDNMTSLLTDTSTESTSLFITLIRRRSKAAFCCYYIPWIIFPVK